MILNLNLEHWLVIAAHVVVWFVCLPRIWNTSGLPGSEFRRLKQRYWDAPTSRPVVLIENTLFWSLTRSIIWTISMAMLAKNYAVSHRLTGTAVLFIILTLLAVEMLIRFKRMKYQLELRREGFRC